MRALFLILLLAGCTQYESQIREAGGQVFDELEASSTLVTAGARRYLCRTARVGPLLDSFDTTEEQQAWQTMCLSQPTIGEPE